MLVLLRLPCLIEDEGNVHFIETFETEPEMIEYMKDYLADGYFCLSDFCFVGFSKCNYWPKEEDRDWMPRRLCADNFRITRRA